MSDRHPDGTLMRCDEGMWAGSKHRLVRYVEGHTAQGPTLFVLMRPERGPAYHMRASQLARWIPEVAPQFDSREQGTKSAKPFIE